MEKQTERQERNKRMVKNLEEMGSTLMLVGITSLFLYLTIVGGVGVPAFTLILGGGVSFAAKIIRDLGE